MKPVAVATLLLNLTFATFAHAELAPMTEQSPLTLQENSRASAWSGEITGQVRDSEGKAIADVSLVLDGKEYITDKEGEFRIPGRDSGSPLLVKKPGYRKLLVGPTFSHLALSLEPSKINAIYLPWGVINNSTARLNSMSLINSTELNAVVLDVKGDSGDVHSTLKPTVDDLHEHGVYAIGRVTTFKDTKHTRANPELGLQSKHGGLWTDRKGNSYLNPYDDRAQDYVISIAKMAAASGLDEVQFDYVRFPTDGDLSSVAFTQPYDAQHRTDAIARFVKRAREALGPMGVFVAADLFGIAAYEKNDISKEGQNIEKISPYLDYLCPMVYPSGYGKGPFYDLAHPVAEPKQTVEDSVRRYRMRASDDSVVRPWLQAFRDYAYDHRPYGAEEIRAQIDGSDSVGGSGFLLWNAGGRYSDAGLRHKQSRLR